MRIGLGYDIHAFEPGKPLVLGGVSIPFDKGLKGHSDGDVVLHALIDAILGALGEGDIGTCFPDTDPRYKDINSAKLLKRILLRLSEREKKIVNIDINIHLEFPRLESHKLSIRKNIAALTGIPPELVNVKAKTHEKLGFIGRGEGIATDCVILLDDVLV